MYKTTIYLYYREGCSAFGAKLTKLEPGWYELKSEKMWHYISISTYFRDADRIFFYDHTDSTPCKAWVMQDSKGNLLLDADILRYEHDEILYAEAKMSATLLSPEDHKLIL